MSANHRKPRENASARVGKKKMKILGALAAVTLLTWSRQLFGGEGDSKPAVEGGKAAQAAASEKSGAAAAKAPRAAKNILNFEQAMERMTQWPAALHRRVIQGPIEDLSPINWMLDIAQPLTEEDEAGNPGLVLLPPEVGAAQPQPEPSVSWPQEIADGSSLGLVLRSTVIFGAKRYAVLNGVRYAEGEAISTGSGRYVLVSVRSREVLLSSGDRIWTLVIRDQSAPAKVPDQAD